MDDKWYRRMWYALLLFLITVLIFPFGFFEWGFEVIILGHDEAFWEEPFERLLEKNGIY